MNFDQRAQVDGLVLQAAELMNQQAEAYDRLSTLTEQLAAALVQGAPAPVESATRLGESELLRLRARLAQIIAVLGRFADARAASPDRGPIATETRSEFERASARLMTAANEFQRIRQRAAALAAGGSMVATACIEQCGVAPTTYRPGYGQRNGRQRWA